MTERKWQNWNDKEIIDILEKDWNEHMEQRRTLHKVLLDMQLLLYRELGGGRSYRLLDCGCGTCVSYSFLSRLYAYRGIDVTDLMIRRAKEKFPEINAEVKDILDLTEEDKADVVLSCDVLVHTPSVDNYLQKLWEATGKVLVLKLAYVWKDLARPTRDDWDQKFYNRKFNLKELGGRLLSLKPYKLEVIAVGDDEKTTPEFSSYQVFVIWK